MSLASTLEKGAPQQVKRCGVAKWISNLSAEDHAALEAVVPLALEREAGWNVSRLWETCRAEGLTLERDAFAKHVTARCQCDPR